MVRVAPLKPFRRVGRCPAGAELGQAEPAVLVGVERGKLVGPGSASVTLGIAERGFRDGVGATLRRWWDLALIPEVTAMLAR